MLPGSPASPLGAPFTPSSSPSCGQWRGSQDSPCHLPPSERPGCAFTGSIPPSPTQAAPPSLVQCLLCSPQPHSLSVFRGTHHRAPPTPGPWEPQQRKLVGQCWLWLIPGPRAARGPPRSRRPPFPVNKCSSLPTAPSIRAPLPTPREGPGAGHAPGRSCPPSRGSAPSSHHRLPRHKRRQPRASQAPSEGIARDEPRRSGAAGPADELRASSPPHTCQPWALGAPPRPRLLRPIRGLLEDIYIHPAPAPANPRPPGGLFTYAPPRLYRPIRGLLEDYLHTPRPTPASQPARCPAEGIRPQSVRELLPKCLLSAEAWACFHRVSRLMIPEVGGWGASHPSLSLSFHPVKWGR